MLKFDIIKDINFHHFHLLKVHQVTSFFYKYRRKSVSAENMKSHDSAGSTNIGIVKTSCQWELVKYRISYIVVCENFLIIIRLSKISFS